MTRNRWTVAGILVILFAMWRVNATLHVFSQTTDEPIHIAAGYDWWHGKLDFAPDNPPLARLLFGFPSAIVNKRPDPGPGWIGRGSALLLADDRYEHNLAHARRGNLLFLALLMFVVWRWAARDYGEGIGLLAAAIAAALPPVLGNAGLATTDVPLAATFVWAAYAWTRYLDDPTKGRAAMLGLAIGCGLAAKYSFLLFFPIAAVLILAFRMRTQRRSWRFFAITLGVALIVVLIVFRFRPSFFVEGIRLLQVHAQGGHPAYLFGKVRTNGWWYYFPVALFFKTPLALLVLFVAGIRRAAAPAAIVIALLVAVMPTTTNIGLRHILVVFPLMAIVGAVGAATLWKRSRVATLALLGWYFVATSLAHPDYLAYFNEAAGREPGRILVDSNLDWGQDVTRLIKKSRELHIPTIGVVLAGTAPFDRLGGPPRFDISSGTPARGWIAVSEEAYRLERVKGGWYWLEGLPYMRVGTSIRLYHVE